MTEERYPYETEVRVQITAWAEWRDHAGNAGGAKSIAWDEFTAKRRDGLHDRFKPTIICADAELAHRTLQAMLPDQAAVLKAYHLVTTSTREIARLTKCHRTTIERLLLLGHNEFMRVRGGFLHPSPSVGAGLQQISPVEPHG